MRAVFPVVGLLIGIIIAAFDYGHGPILPPLPASVMTAIAMTAISEDCTWTAGGYGGWFFQRPSA